MPRGQRRVIHWQLAGVHGGGMACGIGGGYASFALERVTCPECRARIGTPEPNDAGATS